MSQDRYPLPDKPTQTPSAWASAVEDGLKTIETHYSGTTDPSSTHGWDGTQEGIVWCDSTNPYSPIWKQWSKIGPLGTDWGWRTMGFRKVRYLTAEVVLAPTSASPAAADVAWEDFDLSTDLEGVQDAGQTYSTVSEAILRVRVKADAAESLGSNDGYIAFRGKGMTSEQRVYAPSDGALGGRYAEAILTVPLNGSEVAQLSVKVGGAAPSFVYEVSLIGFMEPFG